MRKLMWFTIGFGLSCVLCTYILDMAWIVPAVCGAVMLTSGMMLLFLKWRHFRIPVLVSLGCLLGLAWFFGFHSYYLKNLSVLDATTVNTSVTVTDHSYETDYGIGADGMLELDGKFYRVRVYLDPVEQLNPGDRVEGPLFLRVTTPDGSRESNYHQGNSMYLLAYQRDDVEILRCQERPSWSIAAWLRQNIQGILDTCFSGEPAAFAKALLLGDTDDLSYETDTALKISGIRHVVAVSGLHISILFALVSAATFRKRYLSALVGFPVLLLFAAVAGFTPSVVRACIMCAVMLLAKLADREYDGPTALSFAVLLMLLLNPMAVSSVSLQLSAGSVAGIFLFREGIENWIHSRLGKSKKHVLIGKLKKWFSSSVAITLSAMSLTTPLCAFYFGMVSLIGVVTNLLTLWVISFIFYGLMAVCGLSLLWQSGAMLLAKVITVPIRYVLLTAKCLASLPMAAVYTQSIYIVFWLIFCYMLLGIFLLQKNRKPGTLLSCAVLGLCIALVGSWLEPALDDTRVTVIDVGQGQAILLQSEGCAFLVDCGGDSDTSAADRVAGTLLSQGISHLDGILLTHYDADHCGAVEHLLTRISSDLLLSPDTVDARSFPPSAGTLCYVDSDMSLTFGDASITVFGPIYSGSDNENSLCVLFETENCAILITGDRTDFGERMLLRSAELPDVDMLIAGHHGAKTSTSMELLEAVNPETVIISVGEGNYYGHPHDQLLQRLEEFGCAVYRTDIHGTIVYRR